MKRFLHVAAAFCLFALAGCKPDPAVKKAELIGRGTPPRSGPPAVTPAPAPADGSTIIVGPSGQVAGTVLFTGKAPAKVHIDTSMDPACGLGGKEVFSEQYAVTNGKLANVFVYVKQGPAAAMAQPGGMMPPVVLDQRGCQYVPHVVGVAQGSMVEFRNSDPTMHNIHTMPATLGNETVDISQGPRGAPVTRRFDKAELMIPVRCNNHPWMNAFINVSPTAFFAVSDSSGHFDLRGLPPGTYTLAAVHEKMGEKDMQVTVPANGTARAELSFGLAK